MSVSKTVMLFGLLVCTVANAIAEEPEVPGRGLVTTGPCPLTCRELGVPAESCREVQVNAQECEVEDFSQVPGHRSMVRVGKNLITQAEEEAPGTNGNRRGLITSSPCPYSCKIARVPESLCHEWTAGNTCYVEDFSQPPGHRSRIVTF